MLSNAVQIELTPEANSLIFGVGILGAAFLLAWSSEAAERYMPSP